MKIFLKVFGPGLMKVGKIIGVVIFVYICAFGLLIMVNIAIASSSRMWNAHSSWQKIFILVGGAFLTTVIYWRFANLPIFLESFFFDKNPSSKDLSE